MREGLLSSPLLASLASAVLDVTTTLGTSAVRSGRTGDAAAVMWTFVIITFSLSISIPVSVSSAAIANMMMGVCLA